MMTTILENRWVRFFRNYGPIPTNDNMYDETIQRAISKLTIDPIKLPAPFLHFLLENFNSDAPRSEVLTGTAGDGKTYHCREVWIAFGGSAKDWNKGSKINVLPLGGRELVIVKDLSELREESRELLQSMAEAVANAGAPRLYLIAANHGQLLEKLKEAPQSPAVVSMAQAIEDLLVTGENRNPGVHLNLRDLSRAPASETLAQVVKALTQHAGWDTCDACPAQNGSVRCPIWENRCRLQGSSGEHRLLDRLTALVEISEQNGVHFPVRQILSLVSNVLLGHPEARDGLMTCLDVPGIFDRGTLGMASAYRNIFGDNLKRSRAQKTDPFRKLASFNIGGETSSRIDSLLVYGADDPELDSAYQELVLSDPVYGGTSSYAQAQRAYLEGYESESRAAFLSMLRAQRQRLFFTLPESEAAEFGLWDLTVFRYGGPYLQIVERVRNGREPPHGTMSLIMRGLNRVFTGMLVQNQDELVLATSGSHSQSKASPLLDELISVPRQRGEGVSLVASGTGGVALSVRLSRDDDPGAVELPLTAARFEFLGRVAEGALPSSFSVECYEDILAFKAKLLTATERRRKIQGDEPSSDQKLVLRFIEVGSDGRAAPRRITVRA
jgi:hypothetical protein